MIISVLFTSKKPIEIPVFRGKDLSFWITEIFSSLNLHNSGNSEKEPDVILFFYKNLFPKINKINAKEIHEIIKRIKPEQDKIFSFNDQPFFIVPGKIFHKLGSDSSQLIKKIKSNSITTITLAHSLDTVEIGNNLSEIEGLIKDFQIDYYLNRGVVLQDFSNFYIEGLPQIGKNSKIGPGTVINQHSTIGKNVEIYPNCYLENSKIGDSTIVLPGTVIRDSILKKQITIGPFAHIRNNSVVENGAKIGNFVEMKKSLLSAGAKSMHLSYIGDAKVGKNVNIGAGTITCNYDGKKKNPTVIEDNVFIGSGTELVAPITIRKNSYIAAGSTITEDVPQNSLAVARNKQRNILDWVLRKKKSSGAK